MGDLGLEWLRDEEVAEVGSSSASSGLRVERDFFVDFFFFFLGLEGSDDRVFLDVLTVASLYEVGAS